jgi:hypothetical protein
MWLLRGDLLPLPSVPATLCKAILDVFLHTACRSVDLGLTSHTTVLSRSHTPALLIRLDVSYISSHIQRGIKQKEHAKPWKMSRLWDVEAFIFSRQSAQRWQEKVVSLTRRVPVHYPQRRFQVSVRGWRFLSVRGWVNPRAIMWMEELGQLNNPVIWGIEPVTFLPEAQCLDQLRYRVPRKDM